MGITDVLERLVSTAEAPIGVGRIPACCVCFGEIHQSLRFSVAVAEGGTVCCSSNAKVNGRVEIAKAELSQRKVADSTSASMLIPDRFE